MSGSPTVLSDLPQNVCNKVAAILPDLKECKPHAGRFDIGELTKSGLAAPAVLVSVLGAKADKSFPGRFSLQVAAYVVTKDGLGSKRDVAAANICQVLLASVPREVWAMDALGEAENVGMHTLISTKTKGKGVSLWAVTWDQPVTFVEFAPQPLGAELYVAGPMPDPELPDFVQIGGAQ